MKKSRNELKASARESLLGHYGTVICALLFSQLITLVINLPFDQMTQQGVTYQVPSRAILGVIGSLLVSLVSVLLEVGLCQIHLQIARKEKTSILEIFYPFKNRPDKFLGYSVLIMLVSMACTLPGTLVTLLSSMALETSFAMIGLVLVGSILLGVGCVILLIFMLAWGLTPYILLDNPSMSVLKAMKLSSQLMKGNKCRLFTLYLSFLGWILFSLLTFGIALLWILPYINQTLAWFYLDFIAEEP